MEKNDKYITVESTSPKSARIDSIVLRETSTTQLLFAPELIDNLKNKSASVKGAFYFQKKLASGEFIDHKELNLNTLRAEEWIRLHLKSDELYKLIQNVNSYYAFYDEHGIPYGKNEFAVVDTESKKVLDYIISNEEILKNLFQYDDGELFIKCMKSLSNIGNLGDVTNILAKLEIEDISGINNILGIAQLKKILKLWNQNKNNHQEEFWQKTFEKYPWILAQCFATPTIIVSGKAYVGGKTIANVDGKIVDFLYKNRLTDNLVLIEIKTPNTALLGNNYRTGIYSISNELSGAINQILIYKDSLQKHFHHLVQAGEHEDVFNPKCVIVAGNTNTLINHDNKANFELFRNELKNIQIVTYDEVFTKAQLLLNMLEGTEDYTES